MVIDLFNRKLCLFIQQAAANKYCYDRRYMQWVLTFWVSTRGNMANECSCVFTTILYINFVQNGVAILNFETLNSSF